MFRLGVGRVLLSTVAVCSFVSSSVFAQQRLEVPQHSPTPASVADDPDVGQENTGQKVQGQRGHGQADGSPGPLSFAGFLLGQNFGHANFDVNDQHQKNVGNLARQYGCYPAILSVDYGYDEIPKQFGATNRLLTRHHQQGGIVTISMHPPNPWRDSDSHDVNIGDFEDLFDPDSAAYRVWKRDIDRVARGLTQLKDAGVTVWFRPFHEMNGGWFWWCPERDLEWLKREQFVRLWRELHHYLTHDKQLDNLVWVYGAAVQTERHHKPADYFYPGDEFVDVLGLDWYTDDVGDLDRFQSYTQLARISQTSRAQGSEMPIGLTEFGPATHDGSFDLNELSAALKNDYPAIRFVTFWHSWPGAKVAVGSQSNVGEFLDNPRTLTRSRFLDAVQRSKQ